MMLQIFTISVTPYQQNARILFDDQTKQAVIIDPGGDIHLILNQLPTDAHVESIWVTHSHIDHVSGVSLLLQELKKNQEVSPRIFAHENDALNRENLPLQSQMLSFPYSGNFDVTNTVDDGDVVCVGQFEFLVLHTPGHAIGHISFYLDHDQNVSGGPIVIAGDALFNGSIGRTDLPGGNHTQLIDSIRTKLLNLPDQTVVYSGHGPNTSIGKEKLTNPFLVND